MGYFLIEMKRGRHGLIRVRHTEEKDIDRVLEIFELAKDWMARNDNPNQWKDRNFRDDVIKDIESGNGYVITDDECESVQKPGCRDLQTGSHIVATFALIFGEDPTYSHMDGGWWLNDEPYATIHRLASSGERRGIFKAVLEYAMKQTYNIRADTHEDNKIMRSLLKEEGFEELGIIYLADKSPRIAYHYVRNNN